MNSRASQRAGELAGGDGFAAFRDFDDDDCQQDTPLQDILDECSDGQEGYIALAKPGDDDPKTQAEAYARDRDGWRASEQKEIENHIRNGSWELVERSSVPRGRALIKLIWVYKVKRDGSLKSRLCVCKAAGRCKVLTTIRRGAARCVAPRFAFCRRWLPSRTCACAAGTSLPPTCKVNYSKAKWFTAYLHRAKDTRPSAKMGYPWYAKS